MVMDLQVFVVTKSDFEDDFWIPATPRLASAYYFLFISTSSVISIISVLSELIVTRS